MMDAVSTLNISIFLIVMLAIIAGLIYLQFRLSKSENKYVGLVLPIMFFLLSLIVVLGQVAYYETKVMLDGVVTEQNIVKDIGIENYIALIFPFLICNIPTAVLMAIYLGERSKINTRKAIDRMKIEDI
ncbi:MAG: hypothetical protein ACOX0L_01075 [Natronincolaceae bacterium]|jgi:hypothetical protein|nr:hypothetical protein [Bacillota bacterium]NLK90636.1 hypothetical protein [Clostridiales bacterium]